MKVKELKRQLRRCGKLEKLVGVCDDMEVVVNIWPWEVTAPWFLRVRELSYSTGDKISGKSVFVLSIKPDVKVVDRDVIDWLVNEWVEYFQESENDDS